jgi:hypothetical protein
MVSDDLRPGWSQQWQLWGDNDAGLVVGFWNGAVDNACGFLLRGGQFSNFDLGLPGFVRTEIHHVSLDGHWLTGVHVDGTGLQSDFVFDRTNTALKAVSARWPAASPCCQWTARRCGVAKA